MNRWIFALLLAGVAGPSHALRCGNRLVDEGDTRGEVQAKCGAPAEIVQRTVVRKRPAWIHGRRVRFAHELVESLVEHWVYNLGPHHFMRRVKFEDGVVVEIESLGYGYSVDSAGQASSSTPR